MTNVIIIVNPVSAGGATGKRWPHIAAQLKEQGLLQLAALTEGPGHATELARQAVAEGADLVISVGGEGTLNEIVNGLVAPEGSVPSHLEVGIIPSGTGNDFIRSLGTPKDPLEACRHLARAQSKMVDLGEMILTSEGHPIRRYFFNVASLGFDGQVVERVNRSSKALGGTIPYLRGLALTALTYQNPSLRLEIDGQPVVEGKSKSVAVCIGCYFGGGMFIAPQAALDDGILEVIHFGDISNLEFLLKAHMVYKGTHLTHPLVRSYQARQVRVESDRRALVQADGELAGEAPVEFRILPRALQIRA